MARIAVDVVLLPERAVLELAIAANAELVKQSGGKIILNKDKCIPHISLSMGCIENGDITHIGELLTAFVEIVPKHLKLSGVQKEANISGEVVSTFGIERTDSLKNLHEKICKAVEPYFVNDVTEQMIAGEQASESTMEWIRTYFSKSSYANFSPHITIGYGELADDCLPADFAISSLAMCHLGNYCTCAEIIWSRNV